MKTTPEELEALERATQRDRIMQLVEWLESGTPQRSGVAKFDMKTYYRQDPECGTTCCLAGAAVMFFAPEKAEQCQLRWLFEERWSFECGILTGWGEEAAKLLGLNREQAEALFIMHAACGDTSVVANTLRRYLATGDITLP